MPSVSFVADDLTGAADVLAQAHRYGLDAVLVVGGGDAPMPTHADVVGVAGPARSLGGADFDELVRAELARIARTGAEVLLYKVCSTFDSLPTLSSGQNVTTAAPTYAAVRSTDLLMLAGGGVAAHPDGPAAGVVSLRQAWSAAIDGVPLQRAAEAAARTGEPALLNAVRRFGHQASEG